MENSSHTRFKWGMVRNRTFWGGVDRVETICKMRSWPGREGTITTRGVLGTVQRQGTGKCKETQGLCTIHGTLRGGRERCCGHLPLPWDLTLGLPSWNLTPPSRPRFFRLGLPGHRERLRKVGGASREEVENGLQR